MGGGSWGGERDPRGINMDVCVSVFLGLSPQHPPTHALTHLRFGTKYGLPPAQAGNDVTHGVTMEDIAPYLLEDSEGSRCVCACESTCARGSCEAAFS